MCDEGLVTSIPGLFADFVDPDDREDIVSYPIVAFDGRNWKALIVATEPHLMTIEAYEEDSGMQFIGIIGPEPPAS
jgi:hypothetical protein